MHFRNKHKRYTKNYLKGEAWMY